MARSRLPFPQHNPTEMRHCSTHQYKTSERSGSTSIPGSGSQTPSNGENLTRATKALNGKRNPELLESQNWGSLASLLSHKDHAVSLGSASAPDMWHLPTFGTGMPLGAPAVPGRQ